MPIYTDGIVTRRGQVLEEYETPFSDYLGAKWDQMRQDNPLSMLSDTEQFNRANGPEIGLDPMTAVPVEIAPPKPRLTREEIEARTQSEGVTVDVPENGLSSEALDILIKRKKDRRAWDDAINRSPTGARSAAGFGVQLAAGILDPLNIGLAFVPVVGEARYAAMIAKAGGPLGRAGVRAGVGALEGGVGVGLFEPFNYSMHQTLQDDYSALDSLMNIGFGSVMGGGLHVLGGAAKDAMLGRWWEPTIPPAPREIPTLTDVADGVEIPTRTVAPERAEIPTLRDVYGLPENIAPEPHPARFDPNSAAAVVESATPATREAALRTAIGQAMEGRGVDVEPVLRADVSRPVRQTDLPAFRQWFGDSKVVDEAGQPLVVYHGTNREFDEFDPHQTLEGDRRDRTSPIFFSTDKDYAAAYMGGKSRVVEAYVRAENIFDVRNPEHLRRIADAADVRPGDWLYDKLKAQDWSAIESDKVQDVIRKLGYDGFYTFEGGRLNIGVYDPRQIKSSIGNSGRFDPNSASLTDPISSAERQRSVESVRVADVKASEAADTRVAEAPKSDDLKAAESELAAVEQELQRMFVPVERAEGMFAELKVYDDAISASDGLGRAAQAAAICDLRG
jgi:hypothetical protein